MTTGTVCEGMLEHDDDSCFSLLLYWHRNQTIKFSHLELYFPTTLSPSLAAFINHFHAASKAKATNDAAKTMNAWKVCSMLAREKSLWKSTTSVGFVMVGGVWNLNGIISVCFSHFVNLYCELFAAIYMLSAHGWGTTMLCVRFY